MESRRSNVLRALAQVSNAVSDFSSTMQAATEGDEGAVAYRSLGATTNAPSVDAETYYFLKNPPVNKMGEYYKNVSDLLETVCTLKSSMPSDKLVPNLVSMIDETSSHWFGFEMCVTALGNVKILQNSLAEDSGDGCPICLEQFVEGAHFTTICNHKFCTTCWDGWKKELLCRTLTCPLCRKGQPVALYDHPSMPQIGTPSFHHRSMLVNDHVVYDADDAEMPVYRSLW